MIENVKKIPVYVLLLENSLLLDVVGPVEVLQYANRLGGANFEVYFVGPTSKVSNSIGLSIIVSPLPSDIEDNAWVLVPGLVGDIIALQSTQVKDACIWLQQHSFARIISVCGGALVLAKAGLLTNKKCTTHYLHIEQLRRLLHTDQVLENRLFVQDNQTFTSAGISAGIDLALYLIEQYCGAEICAQITRRMVLFTRRGAQDPAESPLLQHRNHLNNKVHQVHDLIQAKPASHWSLVELANHVHCSERHLTRIFKQHTGMSSKAYQYKIRLTLAKQLLQSSHLTIEQVSRQCGFDDPRQFRRLWAREHDSPPSLFRDGAPK